MTKIEKFWFWVAIIVSVLSIATIIFGIVYCACPYLFCDHLYLYGTCIYCGAVRGL